MLLTPEQDPIGQAIKDYYYNGVTNAEVTVHADLADDDKIPAALFFRNGDNMPTLEQHALEHCYGKVLDVGAGAGCHSLVLQENGLEVHPIDVSPGAVEVMRHQGLKTARQLAFFDIEDEQYNTLLLMMNGVGLVSNLAGFVRFLKKADSLLLDEGQILFDTSDIEYMFFEEDGSQFIDQRQAYYGEVVYQMQYKDITGPKFGWLYLDFITLTDLAHKHGFNVQLLYDNNKFNYLVRLTRLSA